MNARRRRWVGRARTAVVIVLGAVLLSGLTACVGSGKVGRTSEITPLPEGLRVVYDLVIGCREGESGFDYHFVIIDGTEDLSPSSPLLAALRAEDFYHSQGLPDDLPWISVGYQKRPYALRAEIGLLRRYLEMPSPHLRPDPGGAIRLGPDPATLPADVREHPENKVLVALRPTDFACYTPL